MASDNKQVILWAEDDEDDVFIINERIMALDKPVDVTFFNNGHSLLEVMGNWDEWREVSALIVLDINMPLVSADEAYKRIKENAKFNSTVIVFFSTCFRFEHPEYFKK